MPNLDGLGLQNFRTFKKKENLEFAPITLITGTNNAGKSSVFKAIQFLVHNFKEGIVSETLDFKSMKHELGNLERIINRDTMEVLKKSEISKSQSMYSRLSDFNKMNNDPSDLPIFEKDEDLVFTFPIKFGGNREISAALEVRYELNKFIRMDGIKEVSKIAHTIKNIAIIRNGEYLHWSNVIGYINNYDDAPHWEMETSIDLKKIIQLISETPFVEKKEYEPNEKTEKYFTIDLYTKIEKYNQTIFDFSFFKRKKDGYEDFTEKLIEKKSLFSDYSGLTEEEMSKVLAIEQKVTTELLKGKYNSQYKILECFKHNFSSNLDGMEIDIVNAELKEEEPCEKQDTCEEKKLRALFKTPMFQTTPNSELFTNLLRAIEKDFIDITQKKIDSLNKVYFLPTTRGRNREWFIDEQNSEDIQNVRDFSAIYLEHHPAIQKFVNFWIGKGEIDELDKNGNKKQKGFKIGKELSVFRDETIGLTKIFLVDFDETKIPLVDLGYGVSQLLPIIMKIAIIAEKHKITHEYDFNHQEGYNQKQTIYFSPSTLLIEEPEANLHPSLQSKIAELFIDAASRFNIQFLVETHSEYLIYKFQEYIGRKIVSPSDVKMYYFNHPNDVKEGLKDKYISEVQINKDGSIDYEEYFGEGFFDEQNNLKLSLLNIQRDRFVEDYDSIKEKLKESNDTLKGYDIQIEELNQELSTATIGKNELKEQIDEVKREREEKELKLQELIKKQENIIDDYTAKTDYSNYLLEIETIIDKTKIDNLKTLQYLSTGKYLLKNLGNSADFAPVIIQYGRAVEFEMIKWMNNFKNLVTPANKSLWSDDANYKDKLIFIFSNLGYSMPSPQLIGFDLGTVNEKKICFYHLKTFTNSSSTEYKFGDLTQIFELLYYISPARNSLNNYISIPLMREFYSYLNSIFSDYNKAEGLFINCRNILNLRNCAGHTYSNNLCSSNIIDKSTAEDYVAKVEAIFKCL